MKKAVLAGAVVLAMTAIPAFAQTPDNKQTADKTMAGKSTGDQKFVMDVAHVGMAEVELGKMATEKASNDQVKKYGQRMADEHAKAGDELKAIAQKNNITWPMEMDAKHKAVRDRLSKLSGEGFDRAYMQEMVAGHRAAVNEFKMEAKNGKIAEVQAWASKTQPTIEDHLKQAQDIARGVVGTSGTKK
jgi:putative membrane protein